MSAKSTDDGRVAELYRVIGETCERIKVLGLTRDAFVADESVQGRINADAIFMCILRAAEEAGNMSDETKRAYPHIPWRAIHGMRNIFTHDYGKLDRSIVWSAVADDFPLLENFCREFAEDHGFAL